MLKISSGIKSLDDLIDLLHIGDNVVWEIEAGTSEDVFVNNFVRQSLAENRDVIYVSFNRSPQSILLHLNVSENLEKLTILDCFTSGKGKSDRAFLKFYETKKATPSKIINVSRPDDISLFSETVNKIQDGLQEGARYIFDSLTGMQDLWGDENNTHKFFTYMCPRLYDLGTVAYWILEKEAHNQTFKANLRHITQVVLELYKRKEKLFLRSLKLEGRTNREAFKPHSYEIEGGNISVAPVRKEALLNIGNNIKDARLRLNMSQKDLAEKIGVTSSFISQIENNQISPSLNSFLQLANTLGINPASLLPSDKNTNDLKWLIKREAARKNLFEKEKGYSIFSIVAGPKTSAYIVLISPGAELSKHFLQQKKEELIHVLKGKVFVKVEGNEKELKTGDSVYLEDSLPLSWKNKTSEVVELLVTCT